jgi:hypothetical protein
MGFIKKIMFWKKRNNYTPIKVDASVSTEDPRTCDAATLSMDPTVMCATYTQTENRMDSGDCGGAVKDEYERQLEKKNKKIRELQEELAVSKRLTENLMLNIKSIEQQLRKYTQQPVISWSDDCECKQKVSSVAGSLKKIIITERDVNKPQATSRTNNSVDCETQTEQNTRRRDCANADKQEIVRRLEDRNGKLSVLVQKYEKKIVLLKEEREHVLRDQTSHIQHIKKRNEEEKRVLIRKIRDMRDEIISLKERRPPRTERHTENHQHNERTDHTGRRSAGRNSTDRQSVNQRQRPNEQDFCKKRNLPPRLQQAVFTDGRG